MIVLLLLEVYISLQESATDNDLDNVNIAYAETHSVMNFKDCDLYYKSLDSYRSINLLELEPMIYGHTGLKDPLNILETNLNATSTTAQLKHSPESIRDKMIWLLIHTIKCTTQLAKNYL